MMVSIKAMNCDTVPYTDSRQLTHLNEGNTTHSPIPTLFYACKNDLFRSNGCVETIIAIIGTCINSNVIDLMRSHDRINQLKYPNKHRPRVFTFMCFHFHFNRASLLYQTRRIIFKLHKCIACKQCNGSCVFIW